MVKNSGKTVFYMPALIDHHEEIGEGHPLFKTYEEAEQYINFNGGEVIYDDNYKTEWHIMKTVKICRFTKHANWLDVK